MKADWLAKSMSHQRRCAKQFEWWDVCGTEVANVAAALEHRGTKPNRQTASGNLHSCDKKSREIRQETFIVLTLEDTVKPGVRQLAIRARRISGKVPFGRSVVCVISSICKDFNNARLIRLQLRQQTPHSLKIDRMQVEARSTFRSAHTVRIHV